MTNFADWADTHLADEWDGQDWDDRERDEPNAWMDEYEYDMGAEDSFLDSYWEGEAEMAFWDGEWS